MDFARNCEGTEQLRFFTILLIIMNQKQRLDRHNLIVLFLGDLHAGIQLLQIFLYLLQCLFLVTGPSFPDQADHA